MKVWGVYARGWVGVHVHGTYVWVCIHAHVCMHVCIVLHGTFFPEKFIGDIHFISRNISLPVFGIYV